MNETHQSSGFSCLFSFNSHMYMTRTHTHTHQCPVRGVVVWTSGGQMKARAPFLPRGHLSPLSLSLWLSVSPCLSLARSPWAGQSDLSLSLSLTTESRSTIGGPFELCLNSHSSFPCVPQSLHPRKTHKRSETGRKCSCYTADKGGRSSRRCIDAISDVSYVIVSFCVEHCSPTHLQVVSLFVCT